VKFELIVSERANDDLLAIMDTIAQNAGERRVEKYLTRVDKLYDLICERPAICAPYPRLGANVRVGIVHPYLVVYRYILGENSVGVLRILHGRRNITRRALS
jgi:toxin ParE1/3/4